MVEGRWDFYPVEKGLTIVFCEEIRLVEPKLNKVCNRRQYVETNVPQQNSVNQCSCEATQGRVLAPLKKAAKHRETIQEPEQRGIHGSATKLEHGINE